MVEIAAFETYADMFSDYDRYVENENYDNELRQFVVPKGWAVDWVFIHYRMGFDDFMDEYTWDDTYEMYTSAVKGNVLISSQIIQR